MISNPVELNSDPNEICYVLERSLIGEITGAGRSIRPWFAEGTSTNYPGDGKPPQEFDCKIRNKPEGSENEDQIAFNFRSYKAEGSLISGESIPAKTLDGANLVYDYGSLPAGWGYGGYRAPLAVEIFRPCPSGAHYRVYSAITTSGGGEAPREINLNFKEIVEDEFRKIDKMPFCSEKKPWYRP